jgi:hypothetical protein
VKANIHSNRKSGFISSVIVSCAALKEAKKVSTEKLIVTGVNFTAKCCFKAPASNDLLGEL